MVRETLTPTRIVLIEDNPADVVLFKLTLGQEVPGSSMTHFACGADALSSLCPTSNTLTDDDIPDLILLDLNTPRSDGFEVLGRIRRDARLSRVPVAIVTSSASPADRHRALLLGATAYIHKPARQREFMDEVGGAVKNILTAASSSPQMDASQG
jgi:CheY-like chemotaxis protein